MYWQLEHLGYSVFHTTMVSGFYSQAGCLTTPLSHFESPQPQWKQLGGLCAKKKSIFFSRLGG
ncbi:hypothetical protein OUZ56_024866 [Daphnia magna]|uniref:Uncharacterized protein n=1 Tax=Daphnia magna TaxID=35525 RepID=A0ABQ9ZJM9_9CRUS|nr:hypothetical protein OUZ56_024866 [Daphnia magna]